MNYEIIFCKHARPVKIKNLDAGKVIYGVQAAGAFWINLRQVYNIAFRERDTLAETRRREISEGTDPKGFNTTAYDPDNWNMEDEYNEPGVN